MLLSDHKDNYVVSFLLCLYVELCWQILQRSRRKVCACLSYFSVTISCSCNAILVVMAVVVIVVCAALFSASCN